MAIPTDQPPLSLLMGESPQAMIAEELLTSRKALPFQEIIRRTGLSEEDARKTLQLFATVRLIAEPSPGLYRWQAGSHTGRPFTRLRELLHARQHPDSWAAAALDESDSP